MAEDPVPALLTLLRAAASDGREMDYDESAPLLRAIAVASSSRHALRAEMRAFNSDEGRTALLRHVENAEREVARQIERLGETVAQRDLPVLALCGSLAVAGAVGLFAGTLNGVLGLGPLVGGLIVFGVAAAFIRRSNAQKHRLRRVRDDLRSLADELRTMQ